MYEDKMNDDMMNDDIICTQMMYPDTVRVGGSDVLVVVKEVNTPQANIGDVISFTITLTNNTNGAITNIRLTNLVDESVMVETNSIGVDGVVSFWQTLDELPLPDLQPGGQRQVAFNVTIVREPGGDQIIREKAIVTYYYQGSNYRVESNAVEVLINVPLPQNNYISSILKAEPGTAFVGDVIKYELEVHPINSFNITNAQASVVLDSSLQFIPGSLEINGRPVCDNIAQIPLGDMVGGRITCPKGTKVKFKARVITLPTIIRPLAVTSATISYYVCELQSSYTDNSNDAVVAVRPAVLTYTYQMKEKLDLPENVGQILGVEITNGSVLPGISSCENGEVTVSFVARIMYLDCISGLQVIERLQTVPLRYFYIQQTRLRIMPCLSKLQYEGCYISVPITIVLTDKDIID